jgi:hypothetical protein
MRLVFNLLILVFTVSCTQNNSKISYEPNPSLEARINEISDQVAQQLKREFDLQPCGFGGGTMNGVRMLALSFDYCKPMHLEQARKVLIEAGSLFLKAINDDEIIRPNLVNFPFEPKNIEIRIFFYPPKEIQILSSEKLIVASLTEGVLRYKIDHPQNNSLLTICSETYDEALGKLKEAVSF